MGSPWCATALGSARVRVAASGSLPAVAQSCVGCQIGTQCRRSLRELRKAESGPRAFSHSAGPARARRASSGCTRGRRCA
eukprot:8112913-Pyramimonas_sp.AAC.1